MSMLSMQYAGTLLGREAVIEFPDSRAEVRYTAKGQMRWRVVDSQGHVSEGCERLSYLQLSDHLHFLNWIEKTGFNTPFPDPIAYVIRAGADSYWPASDTSQ